MILSKPEITTTKVVVTLFSLWVGAEISYLFYTKILKLRETKKTEGPVNTVLFFDNKSPGCFAVNHNDDHCKSKNCASRNIRLITECIKNAKTSVDICMYRLSCSSLTSHLETAIKNGAVVRVFTDGDPEDEPKAVISLRKRGAFVRDKQYDRNKQRDHLLMHHKFVVVDGKLVLTGSLNWTTTAVCGNWEDAVLISEPYIVQKFHDEFEYLWNTNNMNEDIMPPCPHNRIYPTNMSAWKENPFNEVFMFREDTASCRGHMSKIKFDLQEESHVPICAYTALRNFADLFHSAEKSIDVCVLLLNLENIADRFLEAHFNGIKVRMVSDAHMAGLTGSQISSMIEQGIEVRGRHHHATMHHKFIILDDKLVLFGSFNWSMQALCGNSENLVCTNNSDIVKKFSDHFTDLWEEFEPIKIDQIGLRFFK